MMLALSFLPSVFPVVSSITPSLIRQQSGEARGSRMRAAVFVVLGVTAITAQQMSTQETARDSTLESRQGFADPALGLLVSPLQQLALSGQNSLQQLALSGQNPFQQLALSGQNPLQQLELSGQNPLQQLAFSGQNPLQQLALSGQYPLQQLALSGQNPLQQLAFSGQYPLQQLALSGQNPLQQLTLLGQNPLLSRLQQPFAGGVQGLGGAQGLQQPLLQTLARQGFPDTQLQGLRRQGLTASQLQGLGQGFSGSQIRGLGFPEAQLQDLGQGYPGIQQQGLRGQGLLGATGELNGLGRLSGQLNNGLGNQLPGGLGVKPFSARRADQQELAELIKLASFLGEDNLEHGNSRPQRLQGLDRASKNYITPKHDSNDDDELILLLQALESLPSNSRFQAQSPTVKFPRSLAPNVGIVPGGHRGLIRRSGQDNKDTVAAGDHRGSQPVGTSHPDPFDLVFSPSIRIARSQHHAQDQFRFPKSH
ncbi:uncharacterized protein LOC121858773 [Homarus americanus]|uniref:uncharacterized protein LOC121858773 n=1 Tax=Homarus americanus TaxID=6706 RepID=UPI001C4703FC|nr:uncharacterized protein LOC121858773 [Homarus americanus]